MKPAALLWSLVFLFAHCGLARATITVGNHSFNNADGIVEIPLVLTEAISVGKLELLAEILDESMLGAPFFVGVSIENTLWDNSPIFVNPDEAEVGAIVRWNIRSTESIVGPGILARLLVDVSTASLDTFQLSLTDVGPFGGLGSLRLLDTMEQEIMLEGLEEGTITVVPEPKPWMLGILGLAALGAWRLLSKQKLIRTSSV